MSEKQYDINKYANDGRILALKRSYCKRWCYEPKILKILDIREDGVVRAVCEKINGPLIYPHEVFYYPPEEGDIFVTNGFGLITDNGKYEGQL